MSKRDIVYRQLAALMLLISFGGFGAHRFYLGRRRSACCMLGLTAVLISVVIWLRVLQYAKLPEMQLGEWFFRTFPEWASMIYQGPSFLITLVGLRVSWVFADLDRMVPGELRLLGLVEITLAVVVLWMAADAILILANRLSPVDRSPPGVAQEKILASLLLFFLGGFGVHRFYLRRPRSAAIMTSLTVLLLFTLAAHAASAQVSGPALAVSLLAFYGLLAHVTDFILGPIVVTAMAAIESPISPTDFLRQATSSGFGLSIALLLAIDAWLLLDFIRIWRGRLGVTGNEPSAGR